MMTMFTVSALVVVLYVAAECRVMARQVKEVEARLFRLEMRVSKLEHPSRRSRLGGEW